MRIIDATFKNGVVYIQDNIPVPDVKLWGAGKGDSSGVLVIANDECIYIPQAIDDLKNLIKILSDGFAKLSQDVVQSTGGTSDVGGATAAFKTDMQNVSSKLNELGDKLQ